MAEWEGRTEGEERTNHSKCLWVTCVKSKHYPHAFCGRRHAERWTEQLAANLDQAPGRLKGGPYLWPDVCSGIPSPPASPPHGEGGSRAEAPITLVVHGPDVERLEGEPSVSRREEVVVSPGMQMQELVDTVMAVFVGDEHHDEEGCPSAQVGDQTDVRV